ncbi:class I SAM-dependent methyltransferase [Clostridium formicaceticum]|uniref:Demethylrebeccamycin-D-glucose O-methyltransferase n=1 Tax=Clostridium formicaceticum TaxID=1497 RepID=A0AAC9WIN9_9CLOT|nr:class I SAM-dependent methyltransferase [Clostridium formicaceticum]AOY74505.1 SAM-dependent methyltransferase [Clostridium formicaceticum]ARE88860.1 Demethylrebeccamycin-D-glucose O-methyltransferase [Clostridium formicaceticum]
MSEIAKRLKECRKPTGVPGKLVVEDMNEKHFELTGWGLQKVSIEENSMILDIGCGGGRTVNRLASMTTKGKVFGIDYSMDCVNWSKEYNQELLHQGQVEILHASVEEMPFEEDKFDFIFAVETIYFWPNLLENLKEVRRVLKPSGKFIIINEMYASEKFKERNEAFAATGNIKIHTPEELKELLEKAGYHSIAIDLVEEKNWLCCVGEK